MFFALLTMFVALSISAVAAYYSIVGLMAIFAAAQIPIAIMGGVLEVGKLIVASWTFRNWKTSPIVIKIYFIFAICVLMIITSLGIFGFLSRAHLEQAAPSEQLYTRIERINLSIEQLDNRIQTREKTIATLESAFEKYVELGAVTKGLQAREELQVQIDAERERIDQLLLKKDEFVDQKFTLQKEIDKIEVEVGPIRYVASLIYDDVNNNQLEDAVRWVIIILIFVFDPLAIVLVIAGNISMRDVAEQKKRRKEQEEIERRMTIDFGDKKVIDEGNISSIVEEEKEESIPIAVEEPKKRKRKKVKDNEPVNNEETVTYTEDENLVEDPSKPVIENNDLSEKEKTWIMSKWKEKGFKSPSAYMAFLRKFE